MVKAGVLGGAGLVTTIPLVAATRMAPLSFIIASDTHLGRKDGKRAENQWRKAIEEINKSRGEFILHLGDVVDGGRAAQYPIYSALKKTLNKPIHEIPGNHDPLDLFRKHVASKIDRSFAAGDIQFVLFNNAHRDSHDGFITDRQIAWLDRECAKAVKADRKIVMACHVPIHNNKHPDRGWYVKPDHGQKAFYELRAKYGDRILACLHGHFHNGIRGWRDHGKTVEVLCPSICYNQNRNLEKHLADGKTTGFFVNELRPGFLLVTVGKGRLRLQYKPIGQPPGKGYSAQWPAS